MQFKYSDHQSIVRSPSSYCKNPFSLTLVESAPAQETGWGLDRGSEFLNRGANLLRSGTVIVGECHYLYTVSYRQHVGVRWWGVPDKFVQIDI